MPAALVTGLSAPAEEVADVLRNHGFQPLCVAYGLPLAAVSTSIPEASIDCYVQLPILNQAGTAPDGELRSCLARNLLVRFDTLGLVARLLTPDATALLVPGDAGEAALLRLLASAVLAGHGAHTVVAKVVDQKALDTAIPPIDRLTWRGAGPDASDVAPLTPDLNCADGSHVLSLTADYWMG
jgi:hypothetical protein